MILRFALAVLLAVAAFAPTTLAEDVTLSGEPVDINCFLGGRSGEGHASCATSCAERGNPIGFVVKEAGEEHLYLVLGAGGQAAKDLMAEHMGSEVEVTGTVAKKAGMRVITVSDVTGGGDDWMPDDAAGSGSIQNN